MLYLLDFISLGVLNFVNTIMGFVSSSIYPTIYGLKSGTNLAFFSGAPKRYDTT